jgi:hypothetical protein
MLVLQLVGFLCLLAGSWAAALRALWNCTGLRRRLGLRPSPSDRFAEVVQEVSRGRGGMTACVRGCSRGAGRGGCRWPVPAARPAP